ncbi:MAG: tetratricopeptide repeat protein [Candidatus Omnitrophica bacterium]|nr:tetratricopeptide repeat protein [Candidatus Omnitrophota bacterium]
MMPKEPKITLCMIVHNEEANLERALLSVKELVDEIVVVDSNSQDATREIALKHGAAVYDYEWHDDFAAARNFSLKQAQGDWILVLDADEVIAKRDHDEIRAIMHGEKYEAAGFYQRNYFEDPSAENWCANRTDYEEGKQFTGYADVPVIRFFKNIPHIYFEGIVHELVDDTITPRKIKYTDIPIHHYRKDFRSEAAREKQERYLRILLKEYGNDPYSVKTCFLLGRQYHDLQRYPEAVAYLERATQLGTNSELVYTNLASAYYHCTMYAEAIEVLEKVIGFNARYSEAFMMLGIAYYETGRVQEAINSLVKAVNLRPTSVLYRYNLGAVYYKERNLEAAESTLREAVRLCPKFTRAFFLLYYTLEEEKKYAEAIEVSRILEQMDMELFNKIKDRAQLLR